MAGGVIEVQVGKGRYLMIARWTPSFTAASWVSAVKTKLGLDFTVDADGAAWASLGGRSAGLSGWK